MASIENERIVVLSTGSSFRFGLLTSYFIIQIKYFQIQTVLSYLLVQ